MTLSLVGEYITFPSVQTISIHRPLPTSMLRSGVMFLVEYATPVQSATVHSTTYITFNARRTTENHVKGIILVCSAEG